MIVVATDAPLDAHSLKRLAARALIGLGRTGAGMAHHSGDYVITFSTVKKTGKERKTSGGEVSADVLSLLFQAVAEATGEAIHDALFRATTIKVHHGTIEALLLAPTLEILKKYHALHWDRRLPPKKD
jgi:D-aminopeptidase